MDIIISNASGQPIYEQISSQVKAKNFIRRAAGGRRPAFHAAARKRTAHQCYYHETGV